MLWYIGFKGVQYLAFRQGGRSGRGGRKGKGDIMDEEPEAWSVGHRRGCFGGQGSRPLTLADRLPQRGDKFRTGDGSERFFIGSSFSGGSRITDIIKGEDGRVVAVRIQTGDILMPDGGTEFPADDLIYTDRADRGDVTVKE